jgi:hypothetical protein
MKIRKEIKLIITFIICFSKTYDIPILAAVLIIIMVLSPFFILPPKDSFIFLKVYFAFTYLSVAGILEVLSFYTKNRLLRLLFIFMAVAIAGGLTYVSLKYL